MSFYVSAICSLKRTLNFKGPVTIVKTIGTHHIEISDLRHLRIARKRKPTYSNSSTKDFPALVGYIMTYIYFMSSALFLPLTMTEFIPSLLPSCIDPWLNVVSRRPGTSTLREDCVVCRVERVCIEVSLPSLLHDNMDLPSTM
jgi:hypothetical protein